MPMDTPAFEGYQPSSSQSMGLSDLLFGGLRYLGETLGKPAAALRGVLAGQPEQLANLIPFSDAMGITDPSQRVSGRDMLRSWGVVGDQDNAGNFLGGMLAEAATDPTLWAAAIPGGMAKMTGMLSKLGAAPTLGESAGAVASKASSLIPQGAKNMASGAASGVDDLVERLSGSRLLTQGKPTLNPVASVAERGPFGSNYASPLGSARKHYQEAKDMLPYLANEPKALAEMTSDVSSLENLIGNLSTGRLPFGMSPSAGTNPLLGKNMPGMGLLERMGGIPSGAAIPATSLGASAYGMSQEPSPQQLQMLLRRMS